MVSARVLLFKDHYTEEQMKNEIQYFELKNENAVMPSHLDMIDPSKTLKPMGFLPLDTVHRQGKIHQGSWIFLFDSSMKAKDPKLLILKRGKQLVTCPGTWSLLGEHTFRDEGVIETVKRGMKEELGTQMFHYMNKHGGIAKLSKFPVYYERDYGISNEGRIDRQFTYLHVIEMDRKIKGIDERHTQFIDSLLELDDEVAEHKWISLKEFADILARDDATSDDGAKTFCHQTIVSLSQLGLDLVMEHRK
jgi:isopentenyldiphosphate isomerase